MQKNTAPLLKELRKTIARIEGNDNLCPEGFTQEQASTSKINPAFYSFGVKALDKAFSHGAMPLYALHEIRSQGRDNSHALGFLTAILVHLVALKEGPVFWITTQKSKREAGCLYGPGLSHFGLDPARLIFAKATKLKDALWAFEEALTLKENVAVVADLHLGGKALSLTETRRLHLRSEANQVPAFLLINGNLENASQTTSMTRWEIGPSPSLSIGGFSQGLGLTAFDVNLTRNRIGQTAHISLSWDHQNGRFKRSERPSRIKDQNKTHSGTLVSFPDNRPHHAARKGTRLEKIRQAGSNTSHHHR